MYRHGFSVFIIAALILSVPLWATADASSLEKVAWDKMIGVNVSKLTPEQKLKIAKNLKVLKNTRGCSGTLEKCLASGDQTARRHAGFVARMVKRNKTDDFIKKALKQRVASAFTNDVYNIDISGHPGWKSGKAPITIVAYECFECPMCAHLAPKLKKLNKKFKNKVNFVYKFFPVRSHKRGVPSALAGLAAHRQGKFWQMYDLLFANRTSLENDDLQGYARKIGLDMARFNGDMKDKSLMKMIERDKLEGMRMGVDGTPTFFINGKMYKGFNDYSEIEDRIGEELDILEGRIK